MNETPNVKSTSIEAYGDHVRQGKATTQNERILAVIRGDFDSLPPPISRNELEYFFTPPVGDGGPRIKMSSITGRVAGLIESKLIRVHHFKKDPVSNHPVGYLVSIDPEPKQRSFDDFME